MIKALPFFLTLFLLNISQAAIPVNPPQTITHRLYINPIITQKMTGERAVFLGNDFQNKSIRQSIKSIFAQVGIDVHFLPEITWVDDFAFDASPNTPSEGELRPVSHLNDIRNDSSAPKCGDPEVMNMFFLNIAPNSNTQSSFSVRGYGFIDFNGCAIQVGESLLTKQVDRDKIALVIARVIAGNLGLLVDGSVPDNLMNGASESGRLTQSQKNIIFDDFFGTTVIDGFDLVKPIVLPANRYQSWASDNDLSGTSLNDDDGDGFSNFFEFCCGLDPRNDDGDRFKQIKLPMGQAVTISLRKQPDALAAGVIYRIQSSSVLGQWKSNGESGSAMTLLTDNDDVVRVELHQVTTGSRFYRYQFEQN